MIELLTANVALRILLLVLVFALVAAGAYAGTQAVAIRQITRRRLVEEGPQFQGAAGSMSSLRSDRLESNWLKLVNAIEKRGLTVRLLDDARQWLIEKTLADRSYGARPLKRAIQKFIEDELSESLIQGDIAEGSDVEISLEDGRFVFHPVVSVGVA